MNNDTDPKWKDVTSYSRDDKERKPETFAIQSGNLRIFVTCGHIYYRPNWAMGCATLGIDARQIKAKSLEEAKAQALEIVKKKIDELNKDLEGIHP